MGGVSVESGGRGHGGRRTLDAEINMIPMIDLLMVTISFLLITAVWSNMSRIEASTNAPNRDETPINTPAHVPALHVLAADPAHFTLEWRDGDSVVSTKRVARPALEGKTAPSYAELAKSVGEEWRVHGTHRAATDLRADRAVIHTGNDASYREFIAVLDAVSQEQRDVTLAGKSHKMQVFEPVLSTN